LSSATRTRRGCRARRGRRGGSPEGEAVKRKRRDQLTHPPYARPELLAKRPNEVWRWDISKLKDPTKWT